MDEQAILERLGQTERKVLALQDAFATLDAQVARLRGQAAAERRTLPCPKCGIHNQAGVSTCIWCGEGLAAIPAPRATAPIPDNAAPTNALPATIRPAAGRIDMAPASGPSLDFLGTSEFWLNKVGITLLLLGLAFLFNLAVERGWLTEPVRVALGLGLGGALLGVGIYLRERRRAYSQVLLGGSIAAFYITAYAAYQMFHLWPYDIAFGVMALTTALAFGLALSEDALALALIGVADGLATPFVLTSGASNVTGLLVYTYVILSGAQALYWFRRWRSLLWVSFGGGWLVMVLALIAARFSVSNYQTDLWALRGAPLFMLLAFWLLPVLAEYHHSASAADGAPLAEHRLVGFLNSKCKHVHTLTLITPLLALLYARVGYIADLSGAQWGAITLAGTALFGAVAWTLRRDLPVIAYTHTLVALLLVTLGLAQILEGPALLVALALEALVLLLVARRAGDQQIAAGGHLLAAIVVMWAGSHLLNDFQRLTLFGPYVLADLAVIAMAMAAALVVKHADLSRFYRLGAIFGLCLWLYDRLRVVDDQGGLPMLAWIGVALGGVAIARRFAARFNDEEASYSALLILIGAGALFVMRLLNGHHGALAVLNADTLIDAGYVAALLAMWRFARPQEIRACCLFASNIAVAALVWRELIWLPSGNAYITIVWGAYAIVLLLAGLLGSRRMPLVYSGVAALFVVVGKLLLIDMAMVDAVWRVLLFLGFGAALLVLSYLFGGVRRISAKIGTT